MAESGNFTLFEQFDEEKSIQTLFECPVVPARLPNLILLHRLLLNDRFRN